jgi:hypothetical protein
MAQSMKLPQMMAFSSALLIEFLRTRRQEL